MVSNSLSDENMKAIRLRVKSLKNDNFVLYGNQTSIKLENSA